MIELQWEWLGGLPPLRKAAVIGAGSWGTAVAVLLARGGLDVQLGTRTPERAEEMAESRTNERYLPDVPLPDSLVVKRAGEIELAGIDLVCLAVPSAALPQAVGAIGDRVGQRTSVLLLSKGMVAPMAALPTEYVAERITRARAIASLGGPAHAKEAVSGTAALVLGSSDPDLREQLGSVFDEAGLVCERSSDVLGVEVAGAAKNAAALAAAAAEAQGMNAAGIATAQIWRECVDYAQARGASSDTFSGLAGVGDLTATILAPGSRNRRAGELLGAGTPAEQIPEIIGQASEALDSVPLMATCGGRIRGGFLGDAAPREPGRGRDLAGRVDGAGAARGAGEEGGMTRSRLDSWPTQTRRPPSRARRRRSSTATFERLYRDHLRDVYSYSYYRVGNHHDAEDLTEQAFLQAYRHFERARRESNGRPLRPWLIRIAHNLASNYHRDRARRPQSVLDESGPIAALHGTERIVEGREELKQVIDGVRQLPDDRREALIMRFALGMDNREIARALGRSDGATKVLIHRAIKQLQEELDSND